MQTSLILCPGCDKSLKSWKSLPLHIAKCPGWATKIGTPPSKFNFDLHYGRGLYAPELVEGVDYVSCLVCRADGVEFRKRRLIDHLRAKHSLTEAEYQARFPLGIMRLRATTEQRNATTRETYGVDNVFQSEAIKAKSRETSLKKYGVGHASQATVVRARRAATNLDRFGSENPFGSEQIKKRLREDVAQNGWPAQRLEVRGRRVSTNLEKYGAMFYFQTGEFKGKFKAISLENWGSEHPMQSKAGFQRWVDGNMEKFGYPTSFDRPDVQRKTYETNLRNHGGKHSQQVPEVRAKAQAVWMSKYGVDNPSKDPVIKARIIDKIKERFGSGAVPHMTWPERVFDSITPDTVVYTGDWAYWVLWANKRRKNPDFVVLTPAQLLAYQAGVPLTDLNIRTVVEVNGDWWHTDYRGVTKAQREKEFTDGYASVGVECVIVWESDLREELDAVRRRTLGL